MTNTANDVDVLILGGGMAGSACAIHLAKHGVSSQVIDKADFPREKVCGEGLLPEGAKHLEKLIGSDALQQIQAQPFMGIHYRSGAQEAIGHFKHGQGLGLRRHRIDHLLFEQSQKNPLIKRTRAQVTKMETHEDRVTLQSKDGQTYQGHYLIAADGLNSPTRRILNLDAGLPHRKRYALRRHYQLSDTALQPKYVEVSACSGFESYVTPVGTHEMGVAFLVEDHFLKKGPKDLEAKWQHLCQNAHPYLAQRLSHAQPLGPAAACGPLQRSATRAYAQRTLLIGDAAGFVDAITGEGMSLALHTAELAAQAIQRTHFEKWHFNKAARHYARERQKHFRNYAALTHGLLWLIKDKKRLNGALRQLELRPELFSELLVVNQGRRSIFSVSSLRFAQLLLPQWSPSSA